MSKMTKQGLEATLYTMLEFGFKCREQNHNLEWARSEVKAVIDRLVAESDNLPTEVLRVNFRKPKGKKASLGLR
jgi:hypothetical protein